MENNNSLSLTVQFFVWEFNKHKKVGDKSKFTPKGGRCTFKTTTILDVFLKSGKQYKAPQFTHFQVMKYPTLEEPIVKIAQFENDSSHVYKFPKSIISIPLESIESIEFYSSGKVGIIGYNKNKALI